ncbi:MAG: DUF1127 domain-containing protein [Yoonia sp.]|uniref:DUF1127 domain-containing protein n=1 Tax=Yoonia sp. TaxID=2212373 RepID=UPI003EF4F73B
MALHPDNTLISNREILIEVIATPFRALRDLFILMAESNRRVVALQAAAAISDAELLAQGLSRNDVIQRAVRHES